MDFSWKIFLWIILGIVGIYLLLVIPAGLAVLISNLRFRRNPHRSLILSIIEQYKEELRKFDEKSLIDIISNGRREVIEKDGLKFSVDIGGKKLKGFKRYRLYISVGRLKPITIGHSDSFTIRMS